VPYIFATSGIALTIARSSRMRGPIFIGGHPLSGCHRIDLVVQAADVHAVQQVGPPLS
jgi:hypothetical protein